MTGGFFDGARFFRVIDGFMAQFGITPDPREGEPWLTRKLADDPVIESNTRGRVSFASSGPDTRTTQLFINFGDNSALDADGFAPIGEVVDGMDVVDRLYAGYGEGAPRGTGPRQDLIHMRGESYLSTEFPELDTIVRAEVTGVSAD